MGLWTYFLGLLDLGILDKKWPRGLVRGVVRTRRIIGIVGSASYRFFARGYYCYKGYN